MKKFFLVILLFIFSGCTNNEINDYNHEIEKLSKITSSSSSLPFQIEIINERLIKGEISYKIIIDKPIYDLKNMQVMVYHDKKTNNIFPSIGVFDEKVNLLKNDKNNKGIILVGYIKTNEILEKLKITYKVKIKYNNKTSYFIKQF